jgi:hypothetical protein
MTTRSALNDIPTTAIRRNRVDIASHLVVNDDQPITISLSKNALTEQEPQKQLRDHLKGKFSERPFRPQSFQAFKN